MGKVRNKRDCTAPWKGSFRVMYQRPEMCYDKEEAMPGVRSEGGGAMKCTEVGKAGRIHRQRRLPFFCLALVSAFLILLAAGCGIQRTPGGVMRPGAETLGYTVFRLDWQPVGVDKRQDTALKQARDRRDANQFALWIENDRREYIRTLAVTEEAARQAWDGYSTGLNRWFINAGFLGRQQWKDINAAIVPVPADTRLQYTWYGDSFNGSEALPAGTYRYCVEACYGKEPSAYYEGVFVMGDRPDHSVAAVVGIAPDPALVRNVTADFVPDRSAFFGIAGFKKSLKAFLSR